MAPSSPVKRIVIVGGVAAGATAAARARRENEDTEIIILERGPYVSFANCGLPFYFSGEVAHRSALLIQSPETLAERYRLDVRIGHEVLAVDRAARRVQVRLNEYAVPDGVPGSEFSLSWDRLILATGSQPVMPEIPGIAGPHCFRLCGMTDLDRLHAWLTEHKPRHALVLGGGLVGLEMAEALTRHGLQVKLVETAPAVLPSMDPEFSHAVAEAADQAGVETICGSTVLEIDQAHRIALVQTHRSEHPDNPAGAPRRLPADIVVVAAGVKAENRLAVECGLEIGPGGGVRVNRHLQSTVDEAVYVAGDLAEIPLRLTGQAGRLPLAGPAGRQGRVAGANAARSLLPKGGALESYPGALGIWVLRIFGMAVGSVGLTEKAAAALQIRAGAAIVHRTPRAAWMEPSGQISLKLVWDRDSGKLLGGQAIGTDGVDKRIDVLAAALAGKLGVRDLEQLDLSYAPPFNSAIDPLNYAAMVAVNDLDGRSPSVSPAEFLHRFDLKQDLVLDVRMPLECANGHIPGSLNIPVDELRGRHGEIPRDRRRLYIHCAAGFRAHLAVRLLSQLGFENVVNVSGGWMSLRHYFPAPQTRR
jgi:NADPH-dependent 2,4-dienoyl-CoA reductase/sulfur reductase-like enzyme/rhodanese-related sulfurtransferase